jgi:hypothetical protein
MSIGPASTRKSRPSGGGPGLFNPGRAVESPDEHHLLAPPPVRPPDPQTHPADPATPGLPDGKFFLAEVSAACSVFLLTTGTLPLYSLDTFVYL